MQYQERNPRYAAHLALGGIMLFWAGAVIAVERGSEIVHSSAVRGLERLNRLANRMAGEKR